MRTTLAITICLFLLALLCPIGTASAEVIYQFSTNDAAPAGDDGYDPAEVTVSVGANAVGPADGTALASGDTGLSRFWNSEWAGFDLSSDNGTAIDDATEFATGFFELTIAADTGYLLDLTSLDFGSARGGSSGTRLYQLFAEVDGGSFAFGDTPIDSSPGGNETGDRTTPRAASVDLSAAAYQGIESITFRYYPLTPATGNTMGFDGWTLNGSVSVVPEPSTLALAALGLLGLAVFGSRRRK